MPIESARETAARRRKDIEDECIADNTKFAYGVMFDPKLTRDEIRMLYVLGFNKSGKMTKTSLDDAAHTMIISRKAATKALLGLQSKGYIIIVDNPERGPGKFSVLAL
jgi:hypothetical protein